MKRKAAVRLGHKTLRTLMKRSSLWYLPGDGKDKPARRDQETIDDLFHLLLPWDLACQKEREHRLGLGR
jgi:hypothetical protein